MKRIQIIWTIITGWISWLLPSAGTCLGLGCVSCGGYCFISAFSGFGLAIGSFFSGKIWEIGQPFLYILSGVMFTIAYFAIYKKKDERHDCQQAIDQSCELAKIKDCVPPGKKTNNKLIKTLYWSCVGICILVFSLSTLEGGPQTEIPVNGVSAASINYPTQYAFFNVDFLQWDDKNATLTCKSRVKHLEEIAFKFHDYANKHNYPVIFSTCCSGRMPTKNELHSRNIAFVALDSSDSDWQKRIHQTQTYYIEKRAYDNPKMNHDKRANDMFRYNANIGPFIDSLHIKNWVVFGDAFEECVVNAVNGLLDKNLKVTVIEDLVSPMYGGNDESKKRTIAYLKSRGVDFKKIDDILK